MCTSGMLSQERAPTSDLARAVGLTFVAAHAPTGPGAGNRAETHARILGTADPASLLRHSAHRDFHGYDHDRVVCPVACDVDLVTVCVCVPDVGVQLPA